MRYQYRTEAYEIIPEDAWTITDDGNASYYPAFLFIPYEMLFHGGREMRSIPRCYNDLLHSETGLSVLQTDRFFAFMLNCYTMMVWQVISKEYKLHPVFQVYSNDNPIVIISGLINFWIDELEKAHILPTKEVFLNDPYYRYHKFDYQDFVSAVDILEPVVLKTIKKYRFDKVIKTVIDNPCHEDFSHWNSTSKIDFERKWYHSRTKLFKQSNNIQDVKETENKLEGDVLDSILNGVPEEVPLAKPAPTQRDPSNWNRIHVRKRYEDVDKDNLISCIETQVAVNDFLMQISQEDYDLLMMKFHGKKDKEIAEALKLKTHSAVVKRRKRLVSEFEEFSGVVISKKAIRRKKKSKK